MEHSQKPTLGILAEDKTDADCIEILVNRIVPDRVVSKGMGVGGGGNMFDARKMTRFAKSLLAKGCSHLVVVHDLDRNGITGELNDERQLRAKLATALANNPIASTSVIIPIEELEAWLLSEQHPRPQNISNPKNMLRRLDRNYRTSDNAKIARRINIADIAKKRPSFRPLEEFIRGIA